MDKVEVIDKKPKRRISSKDLKVPTKKEVKNLTLDQIEEEMIKLATDNSNDILTMMINEKKIAMLDKALHHRKSMILGGSKVDDKIGVIDNLINTSDEILLGGAMCFTFLHALGYNVGKSIVSEEKVNYAKKLLEDHKNKP